jgi:5-dehydro-2-deoxygluconokinase
MAMRTAPAAPAPKRSIGDLDLVTIGRSSVDLYGQQLGARLEDVASFAKSVGGCPANIAIGAARLGLKSALITRVGDEGMGRFIREQLMREGVDVSGVRTDRERLTALVLLSVRNAQSFPLIFFRERCADMALTEGDVDPALLARAKAVLVTGTHFSSSGTAAAQRKAMALGRAAGAKIVFDLDFRPNLWGLAGHDAGEGRYIASGRVTAALQEVIPSCDLIVGTEEEIRIAGGHDDLGRALRRVREMSDATLVLKRGAMGCVVFDGPIPRSIEEGLVAAGVPVEVCNVLGAGDAFMAGFLRGWLRGESLETCSHWANACGAFAVSRLLCSPEFPTWTELRHFLRHGSGRGALRDDAELNHLHWATTRRGDFPVLRVFALDHRSQLEEIADRAGAARERIAAFKLLGVSAAERVAQGKAGFGMLLDGGHGREALFRATGQEFWIGRPIELPGSRPLRFETADVGAHLVEWPVTHTVKCLCFYHPDDPEQLKAEQEERLLALQDAVRTVKRELLVEIVSGRHGSMEDDTVAAVLDRLYAIGLRPDWWKLEPQRSSKGWGRIAKVIESRDPHCRGVLLLGLEAAEDTLLEDFALAAECRWVKGFAVGRTIFAEAAPLWFAGTIGDEEAVGLMAASFGRLARAWPASGE